MKTISISFALLVFACSQSFADEQRPNVLLIAIDDLRNDLCGLPKPNGLDGRSLRSQLSNPKATASKPAHSFWTGGQRSVRTDRWRLIAQPGNDAAAPQVELFDYQIDPDETRNHAETQPEIVRELLARLNDLPDPSQQSGKLKAR